MYLFKAGLFTQCNPLETHPVVAHINSEFLFTAQEYGYTTVCLTIHLLKDIWVIFRFELLTSKAAINIVYKFLHENKFSVLWDKCNCWALGKSIFSFERNWLYFDHGVKGSLAMMHVGVREKRSQGCFKMS